MEPLDNDQRLRVPTSVLEFQDYIVEQIADRQAHPTRRPSQRRVPPRPGEARISFERLLARLTDLRIPETKPADPIICVALHGYRQVDLTFSKVS